MNGVIRCLAAVLILSMVGAGCSGGSSNVRPGPDPGDPAPVPAPAPVPGPAPAPSPEPEPEPDGPPVPLAVVDTDFRVSHTDLSGLIAESHNLSGPASSMGPAAVNHGTPVAALAASRRFSYAENANLILIRVCNAADGYATAADVEEGIGLGAQRGARVVNVSYLGSQYYLRGLSYQSRHGTPLRDIVRSSNDGLGSAITVAAGNSSENLSWQWVGLDPRTGLAHDATVMVAASSVKEGDPILQQTLIVGGGNSRGDDRHASSAYPGQSSWIQERFLMAPFTATSASGSSDTATGTFSGTSVVAPAVAGMLATLIHRWPHMDAVATTDLLLETADRRVSQYENNTCGPAGDVNCGAYYLGRGFADLDAALRPTGVLSVPLGERVDAASVPLAGSRLALGGAWGDALTPAAFAGMVAFDERGRDYQAADAALVHAGRTNTGARVERLAQAWPAERSVAAELGAGVVMESRLHPDGSAAGERLSWVHGNTRLGGYQFHSGPEGMADGTWGGGGFPGLLSDPQAGLWADLGYGFGLDADLAVTERTGLHVGHWTARGEWHGGQTRSDIEWRVRPLQGLGLSVGYGRHSESGSLLGTRTHGAMSGFGGFDLDRVSLGAQAELTDSVGLAARMEWGRGAASGGALVQGVDGMRTEQMRLGLTYGDDRRQAALVVGRPLRLTGGSARLDVPVGRELDGTVVREQRTVGLRPTGAQTDIEMGAAFAIGRDSRVQVNLLHSLDAGHQAGATDTAFSASYNRRF